MIKQKRIGRRLELWHTIMGIVEKRRINKEACAVTEHLAIADQIAVASFHGDVWTIDAKQLAFRILDEPYFVPEGNEIFKLERAITRAEIREEQDAWWREIISAIKPNPSVPQF